MALTLHTIATPGRKKRKPRIGRGNASGSGTYSGRGQKGQRARSGGRRGMKTRALRKQLIMRTPKVRGFTRRALPMRIVHLRDLQVLGDGAAVNPATLLERHMIRAGRQGVKILGDGTISVKVHVTGCAVSARAKELIEAAGGTIG